MVEEERPRGARRVVAAVSTGFDVVQRVLAVVVAGLLATSALLLSWQVLDRFAFGGGQNWIEEFARLALIWLTFLGAAVLVRERRHLAVDYVVEKLGPRVRTTVSVLTDLLLLALVTVLLMSAGPVWEASSVLRSPSLGIPRSVLAAAALTSYVLTALYCVESLARTALRMGPTTRMFELADGDGSGSDGSVAVAAAEPLATDPSRRH